MKATMWVALAGIMVGAAALPAQAAPLAVDGLKAADADSAITQAGGYRRHHGHWRYPRHRRHYSYYYEPYYYGSYYPYYRHYYRPYRYRPSFGIYLGGHRGWRGYW